jgi:hypothetical protein
MPFRVAPRQSPDKDFNVPAELVLTPFSKLTSRWQAVKNSRTAKIAVLERIIFIFDVFEL